VSMITAIFCGEYDMRWMEKLFWWWG